MQCVPRARTIRDEYECPCKSRAERAAPHRLAIAVFAARVPVPAESSTRRSATNEISFLTYIHRFGRFPHIIFVIPRGAKRSRGNLWRKHWVTRRDSSTTLRSARDDKNNVRKSAKSVDIGE